MLLTNYIYKQSKARRSISIATPFDYDHPLSKLSVCNVRLLAELSTDLTDSTFRCRVEDTSLNHPHAQAAFRRVEARPVPRPVALVLTIPGSPFRWNNSYGLDPFL